MYCSACGMNAEGRYCHHCGARLQEGIPVLIPIDQVQDHLIDWEFDSQYKNIIRVDAVRSVIVHHSANATKGISGEAILALYDKIVASPVSLESLAAVVQPLYESMGIRTGKKRSETIEAPIGRAIARTLCSFALHGQMFQSAQQFESHCVLSADLPSSVCSLKGRLTISLNGDRDRTQITASTTIPGQMYDWGKSNRCLEQLFKDLQSDLGLPPSSRRQAA